MKIIEKSLRKYLKEMAMDFDSPDRPSSDIERRLQTGNLAMNQIPFPKTGNEPQQTFLELISSARYKSIIQKLRQITGVNTPLNREAAIGPLYQILSTAVYRLDDVERRKRKELEKLAVDTAYNLFGLTSDDVKINAEITGMESQLEKIGSSNNLGSVENNPQAINIEEKLTDDLSKFNLAAASRRLKNALIQGAGSDIQLDSEYLRNALEQRLEQITGQQNIYNIYLSMMVTNFTLYWQMPDTRVFQGAQGPAGKEDVKKNAQGRWEINVKGINFIVVLHECIKGLMDYLSLAEGYENMEDVHKQVNTLANETWDIRLGPEIYNRFRNAFTDIIFQYDDVDIKKMQTFFWKTIFSLPDRSFLLLSIEVLDNSDTGKQILNNLFQSLYGHLIDDNEMYEEYYDKYMDILDELSGDDDAPTDEELNQTLDDLLGGIGGITRAD